MFKLTLFVLMSVVLCASANRYQRQQQLRTLSGYGQQVQTPLVRAPAPTPVLIREPAPVQQTYSSSSYSSGGLRTEVPFERSPCEGRAPGDKLVYSLSSTKYIHCEEEGAWKIMDCPALLVFSPLTFRCENTLRTPKGCLSNPCMNGGKCVDLPLFQWRCDCQLGFAGDFCEKSDGCLVDSCGSTGICIPLPAGSPISKYCLSADLSIFGIDLVSSFESNPCLKNEMDLTTFPTKSNSAVFVHCEGNIPHLKFCQYPLIYNHQIQDCDWADSQEVVVVETPKIQSEAPAAYGYGQQVQIQAPAPAPVLIRETVVEQKPVESYSSYQQTTLPPPPPVTEVLIQKPLIRVPAPVPTPVKSSYSSYSQIQTQAPRRLLKSSGGY